MKSFLKNFFTFSIFVLLILVLVFMLNNKSFNIDFSKFQDTVFFGKVDSFEKFIKDKKSINVILGSSLIEEAIIPDSLGSNWYSFTNSSQNLDESIMFLNYYKNYIKVDTVIVEIQPFNFSIENNQQLNGNFFVFDLSLSSGRKIIKNQLEVLEKIKRRSFPSLKNFFKMPKPKAKRAISSQGFSGRMKKQIDIDSLFIASPDKFKYHLKYFQYIDKEPNFKYLKILEELRNDLDINVIYVIPPKSKIYLNNMATVGNDKIWGKILTTLESKNIELWNYESMDIDTSRSNLFWDETHLGNDGAKVFTKIIRKRLRD